MKTEDEKGHRKRKYEDQQGYQMERGKDNIWG